MCKEFGFDVKFSIRRNIDLINHGSNQDTLFSVLPIHNVLLVDGTILPSASEGERNRRVLCWLCTRVSDFDEILTLHFIDRTR